MKLLKFLKSCVLLQGALLKCAGRPVGRGGGCIAYILEKVLGNLLFIPKHLAEKLDSCNPCNKVFLGKQESPLYTGNTIMFICQLVYLSSDFLEHFLSIAHNFVMVDSSNFNSYLAHLSLVMISVILPRPKSLVFKKVGIICWGHRFVILKHCK